MCLIKFFQKKRSWLGNQILLFFMQNTETQNENFDFLKAPTGSGKTYVTLVTAIDLASKGDVVVLFIRKIDHFETLMVS